MAPCAFFFCCALWPLLSPVFLVPSIFRDSITGSDMPSALGLVYILVEFHKSDDEARRHNLHHVYVFSQNLITYHLSSLSSQHKEGVYKTQTERAL